MTHLSASDPSCFALRVRVEEVKSAFPVSTDDGVREIFHWQLNHHPAYARLADREWRKGSMQGVYLAHLRATGRAGLRRPCPEPAWIVDDARGTVEGPFVFGQGSPDGLDEDAQGATHAVRAMRRERAIGLLLRDLQTVKTHLRRIADAAFGDDFVRHGRPFAAQALRVHMRQLALLTRDRDDEALLDLDALATHPAVLEAAAWCAATSQCHDGRLFALHRALAPVSTVDLNRRLTTPEIVRGIEHFYTLRHPTVELGAEWTPVHYWLSRKGDYECDPSGQREAEFHKDVMDGVWGPRFHAMLAARTAHDPVRVLELDNERWLAHESRGDGWRRSGQERPVRALGNAKAHPLATEYEVWHALAVPDTKEACAEEAQARADGDHARANTLRLARRERERAARARCVERFERALPRPESPPPAGCGHSVSYSIP